MRDKVVIVTGGANGIGHATCLEFAQRGAKVVVVDINGEAARETAGSIISEGSEAIWVEADVSQSEHVQRYVKAAMDAYKPEMPRRNQALTAVYYVLRLWDIEALAQAATDRTSGLAQANAALNTANRAQANFRVELDYKEGTTGFLHEMRYLLTQVESRLYLARQGLRQTEYPLARAHAEEMAAAATALTPYVKLLPL